MKKESGKMAKPPAKKMMAKERMMKEEKHMDKAMDKKMVKGMVKKGCMK